MAVSWVHYITFFSNLCLSQTRVKGKFHAPIISVLIIIHRPSSSAALTAFLLLMPALFLYSPWVYRPTWTHTQSFLLDALCAAVNVPLASRWWKHVSKIAGTLIELGGTRFSRGTPNWLLATFFCECNTLLMLPASEIKNAQLVEDPLPNNSTLYLTIHRKIFTAKCSHLVTDILGCWLGPCLHISCGPSCSSLHGKHSHKLYKPDN